MTKKMISKIFAAIFCIASSHAFSEKITIPKQHEKMTDFRIEIPIAPSIYNIDMMNVVVLKMNK